MTTPLTRALDRLASKFLAIGQTRILDSFITTTAAPRNAVDLFHGEWVSKFPASSGIQEGSAPLFEDGRITWAHERLNFEGQRILELGPLEGAHTYMLHQLNAAEILSIEANSRSYLKCLIVKEVFNLHRARFLCGDFVAYLREHRQERFDACVACGVLYHMTQPVELLELLCRASDRIFLWTHYYDETLIRKNPKTAHRFKQHVPAEHQGFRYTLHRREYGFLARRHIGGTAAHSQWLSRDDIVAALRHFGMTTIETACDDPDNPNGPGVALTALRQT